MKRARRLVPLLISLALLAPVRLLADWYVQVAAFADRSALDESAERLKKAGYPIETEAFTPKYGQPLTRLLVGPFATKAEAEETSKKLAAIGWPGYLRLRRTAAPPTPAVARTAPPPAKAPSSPSPPPTPSPAPVRTPTPEAFPAEAPPKETRTPTPPPNIAGATAERAEESPAAETAPLEPPDRGRVSAPVRLRGFFLSEGARAIDADAPPHWTKWRNTLDVELSGKVSEHFSWKLGGRGFYDAIYDLTDFYPDAVRRDQRFDARFRETFVDLSFGDFDVRLGRQNVVWGEVVGLFFADVVSAKDLRDFVARDFDLIRIPQWAARLEWTKGELHAEAIGIPYMTYDEIGVPGSEFYPYPFPPLAPGVYFTEDVRPPNTLHNAAWGGRVSYLVGGFDVSAFYYDSVDASPHFVIVGAPFGLPRATYTPVHSRIHQAGLTASKDLSPVVLKLEAVYTRDRFFPTAVSPVAPNLPASVRQDAVDAVLSADWLPGEWRLNAQVFTHWFPRRDPALAFREFENGVTVLVARKLFDGKLEPEALWIRSLEDQGWMLRAKIAWLVVPALRFTVGADLFGGQALGFFGRYDKNDRVAAEVRYTF
jgi:hypothetical protein